MTPTGDPGTQFDPDLVSKHYFKKVDDNEGVKFCFELKYKTKGKNPPPSMEVDELAEKSNSNSSTSKIQ